MDTTRSTPVIEHYEDKNKTRRGSRDERSVGESRYTGTRRVSVCCLFVWLTAEFADSPPATPGTRLLSIMMNSSPERQRTLVLMSRKDAIEAQINHQLSLIRLNDSTMNSPLLDPQGFPRADIDIVSVRNVRLL